MVLDAQLADAQLDHVARLQVARWLEPVTSAATLKIILPVVPCWRRSPLTVVHTSRAWGSPTSSAVTSQGPTGPKVSALLPLVVVPPCSIWKARSDTSSTMQKPTT
jgi:hypothetical protein